MWDFDYFYNCLVPPPKFYVQLNPIQVNFDVCSCLWFNSFALNLHNSLMNEDKRTTHTSSNFMYFDVKIEAILPRVSDNTYHIHFSISTFVVFIEDLFFLGSL